jgi:hypothetical protein
MGQQLPSEQGFTPQHSQQWHNLRKGKLTSSQAYLFMGAKGIKNGTSERYINKKVMEIVTGESTPEIKAYQLTWGTDWENFVKQHLANKYQAEYFEAEFIQHPDLCYFGGSSDGELTISGIRTTPEIKCPVFEEAIANRKLLQSVEVCRAKWPEIYWQCVGNMILQGNKQALAVSFHHQLPEPYTCTELIIPYDEADANLLLANLALAYEWLKEECKPYGIDIEARYREFATVVTEPKADINSYAR